MELLVTDLATKSDNLRYPFESKGIKTVAASIELERDSKGTLYYTAEFIPCLAIKNIKFEKQITEKDRVASHYDNERGSINSSLFDDDDPEVTYRPEQSTPPPNTHPVHATDGIPAAAVVDVKPHETGEPNGEADKKNGEADKKAEIEGVEMSHEELLVQREWCLCLLSALFLIAIFALESGIIVFHVISGRLSKKGRLEVLLDDGYWPCMSTVKAQKYENQWDYVGEGFIKEIDFGVIWLRLNEAAEEDKDATFAEWKGEAKAFLHNTLVCDLCLRLFLTLKVLQNGPHTYVLNSNEGGSDSTVVIEARYIPVPVVLEPRETVNSKFIQKDRLSNQPDVCA